jgi:hypothetical protein
VPLFTARSNFAETVLEVGHDCAGCRRYICQGETAFVQTYPNPHREGQTCRTVLCNLDDCWETFDFRYWNRRAVEHSIEDRTRPRGAWYFGAMIND